MSLVNPKQFIISARSNGYKDTAYAIAELTDNSIQANATSVEVILFEGKNRNIEKIAIADNGSGMSRDMLRLALGFGESGRDKSADGNVINGDATGMGKFGMGLPNASVSQCKRVEVWSWQNVNEIYYSYLDVQEIIDGHYHDLPLPKNDPIPNEYKSAMFDTSLPSSGTLVVWSDLDKLKWKRASTLFEKSELEIGRMYRKFISAGKCSVRFKVFDHTGKERPEALKSNSKRSFIRNSDNGYIRPNDPLYLTPETSLIDIPDLHKDESQTFFEEKENYSVWVEYQGLEHEIKIRTAVARQEVINRMLACGTWEKMGDTLWGKHCETNIGLSVMRAGRELELTRQQFFTKGELYQVRFSGIEVEIPPVLDEVFGVTNNKQHANNLKDFSDTEYEKNGEILSTESAIQGYLQEIGDEETAILYKVSKAISKSLKTIRQKTKNLTLTKTKIPDEDINEDDKVAQILNSAFNKRDEVNASISFSQEPNYEEYKNKLISDFGYDEDNARKESEKLKRLQSRISVKYAKTIDHSFFEVDNLQGITVLKINPEHEVFTEFFENMGIREQLLFKIILGAWARLEDETDIPKVKRNLERARSQWSQIIEDLFDEVHDKTENDN